VSVSEPITVAADVSDLERVLVPSTADSLLVICKSGEVRVYQNSENSFSLIQTFKPFGDNQNTQIASAGFILEMSRLYFKDIKSKKSYGLFILKNSQMDRCNVVGEKFMMLNHWRA
jgi:uncharacterized protein YjfI (DUF2170 family)